MNFELLKGIFGVMVFRFFDFPVLHIYVSHVVLEFPLISTKSRGTIVMKGSKIVPLNQTRSFVTQEILRDTSTHLSLGTFRAVRLPYTNIFHSFLFLVAFHILETKAPLLSNSHSLFLSLFSSFFLCASILFFFHLFPPFFSPFFPLVRANSTVAGVGSRIINK